MGDLFIAELTLHGELVEKELEEEGILGSKIMKRMMNFESAYLSDGWANLTQFWNGSRTALPLGKFP